MARVIISKSLKEEIFKKFGKESKLIFKKMYSLEKHPRKGKPLANVGGIVIKEIKYKKFRFYFISDSFKLKFLDEDKLTTLLIKFIRMSDKKQQQKTIREIKKVLTYLGSKHFN